MSEKTTEPTIYKIGNSWQKKVYRHMAEYLDAKPIIKTFGYSANGTSYKHLLSIDQSRLNFINEEIFAATMERFSDHKAGDLNRILTNTAASQPYCFNLFVYLQQHNVLADELISDLIGKQVKGQHIEPEFTPNLCDTIKGFERITDESIGDQNLEFGFGTDADIAIFYDYDNDKKGILLAEFKFIEAEFSVCHTFRTNRKKIRPICSTAVYFLSMVERKNSSCGYRKFKNWQLTEESEVFDIQKIKATSSCPFRFGLNQLWRNMLLAEQVAKARNCDEFSFWIFSPKGNDDFLWKKGETEKQFREILTIQGNEHFQKVYLERVFDKLNSIIANDDDKLWLTAMEKKYRIK